MATGTPCSGPVTLPRGVAGIGLTARTICIDSDESREARVALSNPGKMRIESQSRAEISRRAKALASAAARELTKTVVDRHDLSMHELAGNDDSAGMGFAFPLMSGGMLHG